MIAAMSVMLSGDSGGREAAAAARTASVAQATTGKELFGTITGPGSAVDAACFVGFALAARYRTARWIMRPARASGAQAWERDDSTR
jgi:hypothetical protein